MRNLGFYFEDMNALNDANTKHIIWLKEKNVILTEDYSVSGPVFFLGERSLRRGVSVEYQFSNQVDETIILMFKMKFQ